jgi:cobalt/nickel transport system ATP-binding protein
MGTRAKQRAAEHHILLDFTYGVIDKSILRAMLGEDALILTTGSMVRRVLDRVMEFSLQSGLSIPVVPFPAPGNEENPSNTQDPINEGSSGR